VSPRGLGTRLASALVVPSVVLYRRLLLRFPARLRRRFGGEMAGAFHALLEERVARRGLRGFLSAWGVALRDLSHPLPGRPVQDRARRTGGVDAGRRSAGGRGLRASLEDLGFAWGSVRRDPRFTALLVAVLALGLALNAAVFSVVNAYLLRPLPYPEADRIVEVRPVTDVSWTQVADIFERAVSWDLDVFTLVGEEGPEMVRGSWVTPDFLDVYGVRASLGRTFRPEEADPGAALVAMISERLWRERFGAAPDIVGRSFSAYTSDRPDHAESFRIVGVIPADFWHVNAYTDVLSPIRVERAVYVGRLRPDVPLPAAEAALTELARSTTAQLPADFQVRLTPLQDAYTASVRPTLTVLQGAVLLVLLIACSNAIVLLLVRSARRRRELGMRQALGATALRVGRQLAWEGLILSGAAGVLGLAAAALLLDLTRAGLQARLGRAIPGGLEALSLDPSVVMAAAGACAVIGLSFGLVPALLFLVGRGVPLGTGDARGRGEGRSPRRLRAALVASEVALSTALLAGAGLMVRSAVHLHRMPLGFDATGVIHGSIGLRHASYPDPSMRVLLYESLLDRVRGMGDVEAAAMASSTPFSGIIRPDALEGERVRDASDGRARGTVTSVGAGFFSALGIPLLRGRDFGPDDTEGSEPVAIVSRGLGERLWPGRDPLGARVRTLPGTDGGMAMGDASPGPWRTVVGIVDDITRDLGNGSDGQLWLAYPQQAGYWMSLVARRRPGASSASVVTSVERALAELDPDIPFSATSELERNVAAARAPTRLVAWLLGGFAGFALVLSLLGLYGVVAYAARQRRRDIAIRIALGADVDSVTGLFLRNGLLVVALGVGTGVIGGLFLGQALAGQLRGIPPGDPFTHGAVAAGLLLTAACAVWLPARQASRAAPMTVLRED